MTRKGFVQGFHDKVGSRAVSCFWMVVQPLDYYVGNLFVCDFLSHAGRNHRRFFVVIKGKGLRHASDVHHAARSKTALQLVSLVVLTQIINLISTPYDRGLGPKLLHTFLLHLSGRYHCNE